MVFRKKKDPNFQEQVDRQRDAGIQQREFEDADYGSVFSQLSFDERVLDDERLSRYFDKTSPYYDPIFEPLAPYSTRLLRISSFTEKEVKYLVQDLDIALEKCQSRATTDHQQEMLDSLADVIKSLVLGSARHGFLFNRMTEFRKTVRLLTEPKKKKRWGLF